MRRSRLAVAIAVAGLLLVPAAPASAAPHGSAKPITEVHPDSTLCDISGLTYTITLVNISQQRPSGTATPGTATETWSNEFGSITVRNANLAILSDTQDGPIVTEHLQARGLQSLVTTSDGVHHHDLMAAGRLDQTAVFNVDTGELISLESTSTGREASGDFCAVATAALT